MKLSEIITSVRGLLQDDQFSETSIIEAANWLQDQVFLDCNTAIMQEFDSLNAVAGAFTIDYPEDMKAVQNLFLVEPTIRNLKNDYMDNTTFLMSFPNFNIATAAPLNKYTNIGNSMRLSAPLDSSIKVNIDYIRNPKRMTQDSHVCEIPDRYRELISRGTLLRCMEQNEDYSEAQVERAYVNQLITSFNKNEAVGMQKTGPVIMRSNRRSFSND